MKISLRKAVFIFLGLIALFLVLLNWPVVMSEIIQPVSLMFWLLLRTFVLSIDQRYYWWGLIFVVVIFLFQLSPRTPPEDEPGQVNAFNETLRSISHWRTMYIPGENSRFHEQFLEREYIHLLVSMFAARLHVESDFHLHEQLRDGTIPLPENIRKYLFTQYSIPERRTIKTVLKSILSAPARWGYRSSGRIKVENARKVEEILTFFESTLEIDHDNR
jgi:hypothetical protein